MGFSSVNGKTTGSGLDTSLTATGLGIGETFGKISSAFLISSLVIFTKSFVFDNELSLGDSKVNTVLVGGTFGNSFTVGFTGIADCL